MTFTSAFEQITPQQLFSFSDDRYIEKVDREDRHELDDELEFYERETDDQTFGDMIV